MSTNLYDAHHQWRDRPADERFWGLDDLGSALDDVRHRSYERTQPVRVVKAEAVPVAGYDSPDLCLKGSQGPITLSHWAFNQLCSYADAPASYMRQLPAPLAADCINNGLAQRSSDDVQLLLHRNEDHYSLRSLTTAYSRLWNADLVRALRPATEAGWIVPPARPAVDDPRARPATASDIVPGQDGFGLSVKLGDPIAPAGVYCGDRDMFVFLVNPERIVDLDGSGGLMRGVFIYNSEVGAGAFKVKQFWLESVCGNHIVWNAAGIQELKIVHRGDAFGNLGWQLSRQLGRFADSDTEAERRMVQAARRHVIAKEKEGVIDALFNIKALGLSRQVIEATYAVAEEFEVTAKAPPNTAWGFSHGLTRYSQRTPYADERHRLDAAAGKVLALAGK